MRLLHCKAGMARGSGSAGESAHLDVLVWFCFFAFGLKNMHQIFLAQISVQTFLSLDPSVPWSL